MKKNFILFCFCFLFVVIWCHEAEATSFMQLDVLQWPKMKVDEFGCFMERMLGYRDSKFNCDLKGYVNRGDPCQKTQEYYEGPRYPSDKNIYVNPAVEEIKLSWEHGLLQQIVIVFQKQVTEEMARKLLSLPSQETNPRSNVMSLRVSPPCKAPGVCGATVTIVGFEHMGAGEADCNATQSH